MAEKKMLVHLDMHKNQILNAALQVLGTPPSDPTLAQIYWDTTLKAAMIWSGTAWIDLSDIYKHPPIAGAAQPASPTTGAYIISQLTLDNGHVTGVKTRALTTADIGAANAAHVHNFADVIGLPANTILANNTGTEGAAKAVTAADMLVMLAIGKGTAAMLSTGTDTSDRTWKAKDLNDWISNRLNSYLTVVNLALGTRTSTTLPITNTAGTGVTLPVATTALAGLLSGADKTKLDGVAANANNYIHPTQNPGTHPFAAEITTGVQILSQLTVTNEGHVVAIKGRNLTAADLASVMIVAGTNTTSTNQTWSAKTISDKLQAAIEQAQTGALKYIGEYMPSTNTPPLATSTSVKAGDTYVVAGTGTFAGQEVEAGDMIIAKKDNPGGTAANWQIVNKNIPAIVAATTLVAGIVRLATDAETIAGQKTDVAVTPAGLKAALDSFIGGYRRQFGDGTTTEFTIDHPLNTDSVLVQVRDVATKEEVVVSWRATSASTVTISVNQPPKNNENEVLITKI